MDPSRVDDASTARLAELALGTLSSDLHLATISDIESHAELRTELESIRSTLARLDALAPPLAPSISLRERVLSIAVESRRFEGYALRVSRLFDLPESRARDVLDAIDVPERGWAPLGIPGARAFDLTGGPRVAAADCGLVSLMPGAAIPHHLHHGDEWMLVLQGCAQEDDGELHQPGDLLHRPAGTRHSITAIGDEPYVFAVVLNGGFHPDPPVDPAH